MCVQFCVVHSPVLTIGVFVCRIDRVLPSSFIGVLVDVSELPKPVFIAASADDVSYENILNKVDQRKPRFFVN